MPRYTVVMPARNASKTIESAIRSVLLSFPSDLELIVWDDGSTDGTGEVASNIKSKSITVLTSNTSMGGGVARQRILESSDSEFIVNQDADDISLPWRYRIQSKLIEDADFAFTGMCRFSSDSLLHRPALPLSYTPRDASVSLLFHNPLSHPSMMARRSALEEIGGYGSTRVAQDYELWMRAAAHGKRLRRSGIPCISYRLSTSQVSQQADYATRILNSREVINSYGQLLECLLPQEKYAFSSPISLSEIKAKVRPDQVKALIDTLSPHLRNYYRRLYAQNRLGYVSERVLIK